MTIQKAIGHESIGMSKQRVFNKEIKALGVIGVDKFDRETGELIESVEIKNTFLTGTLQELVGMVSGGSTHPRLTQANASLRISGTSGGATTYSKVGSDTSPASVTPTNGGNGVRFRWEFWDDTATARSNLNWAELWNGDPATGGNHQALTRVNITAIAGSKPSTENWRYRYDIEFFSSDADILTALHSYWLQLIAGVSINAWTHTPTPRVRLTPSGGTAILTSNSSWGGTGTTGYLEFVFVSIDGNNNVTWTTTVISYNHSSTTWANVRSGGCTQAGASCGTKVNGEQWTYTWRYTLTGV